MGVIEREVVYCRSEMLNILINISEEQGKLLSSDVTLAMFRLLKNNLYWFLVVKLS